MHYFDLIYIGCMILIYILSMNPKVKVTCVYFEGLVYTLKDSMQVLFPSTSLLRE